ncbi:ParA family protein [Halobacterium zhouii]|uniref:ParA family protein n=1 Tax=Halobacterium zhouii TaxID=2902624 RepID=UPI001E3282E7|nr:ParA family protein [Halobacterium zhouii]
MDTRTAAFVGVAGGAGATRLAVETAAVLARDGASVGVLDAAFATQGLSQYVAGRIDADATELFADETVDPADARYDLVSDTADDRASDTAGELAAYPAFAPFAALAEAKTPTAAERLGDRLTDLADAHDYVVVDTPPVASNQAVAAVTSAGRVAAVLPAGDRGVDSLQRARGRLADVGSGGESDSSTRQTESDGGFDLAIANRTSESIPDADLAVPEHAETGVPTAPVALDGDGAFTASVASLAESVFDTTVDVDIADESLLEEARRKLP